jgi:hypothetical protein
MHSLWRRRVKERVRTITFRCPTPYYSIIIVIYCTRVRIIVIIVRVKTTIHINKGKRPIKTNRTMAQPVACRCQNIIICDNTFHVYIYGIVTQAKQPWAPAHPSSSSSPTMNNIIKPERYSFLLSVQKGSWIVWRSERSIDANDTRRRYARA